MTVNTGRLNWKANKREERGKAGGANESIIR